MSNRVIYDAQSDYKVEILDVIYRQDAYGSWPARIYLPEKHGPLPALLDVHGGAWSSGGCAENELIDLSLAASGMLVFAIECRKAPQHVYPAQAMDVNYATRWLKTHAADYNTVADCVGGIGTSSGGHSLLLSAMRPDDARYGGLPLPGGSDVDARLSYLIAAWPVIDPYGRYLFAKEKGIDFLVQRSDDYFQDHDAMKEGNPLHALERGEPLDLPPALIVQGTADANVPLNAVHRFSEAYRAAGGTIEIEWFPDMPHGFAAKSGSQADRALQIMKDFICRRLTGQT